MSALPTDEELDRQLAQRLASRGWTVTSPNKDFKPALPPAPKPPVSVLAIRTLIDFPTIAQFGGWGAMEPAATYVTRRAHVLALVGPGGVEGLVERAVSWRGWVRDNVGEFMVGLSVLAYVPDFDPSQTILDTGDIAVPFDHGAARIAQPWGGRPPAPPAPLPVPGAQGRGGGRWIDTTTPAPTTGELAEQMREQIRWLEKMDRHASHTQGSRL